MKTRFDTSFKFAAFNGIFFILLYIENEKIFILFLIDSVMINKPYEKTKIPLKVNVELFG
jgi:hypothetical protein